MRFIALFSVLFVATISYAKKIRLSTPEERIEYIRNADVWLRPSWISHDFRFSPELNIARGPAPKDTDILLESSPLFCRQNEEQSTKKYSGKTRKFFCDLLQYDYKMKAYTPVIKPNGKVREIKVKYHEPKREFPAEIIGTRLLWSLGFAADKMFYVQEVYCWGCTVDPFKIRGLDPMSAVNPRRFSPVAIESKFPGEEIVITKENTREPAFVEAEETKAREGWAFHELKHVSQTDAAKRRTQLIERDALLLLSIFIQHSDNKMANQRLVCTGKISADGKCLGQTVLMLQDVGATFGEGRENTIKMSILDYKGWVKTPIWFEAEDCQAHLGFNFDIFHMKYPKISEEGRQFLLQLLDGFTAGAEGIERVKAMFRAGHADRHGATIEQWTETFMNKVEQIRFPLGRENPDFQCPRRVK